jgi:hypothetical protein
LWELLSNRCVSNVFVLIITLAKKISPSAESPPVKASSQHYYLIFSEVFYCNSSLRESLKTIVNEILDKQNTHFQLRGNMLNKILPLALTGLIAASSSTIISAALVTNPLLTPSANAQSQRYQVIFWYTIDGSNDGWGDNTVELYGDIFVNGQEIQKISRSKARSREAGQTLQMVDYFFTTDQSIVVNATLNDRDRTSGDDPVFRMDNLRLNLASYVGRERTVRWSSGGGEGATLHMQVVRA